MKLPNFWDYIAEDKGVTRSISVKSGTRTLILRREDEDVWKYRFLTNDDDWGIVDDVEGSIVLDVNNRTLIKQTVTRDTFASYRRSRQDFEFVRFRRMASLFFIDAVMYYYLPTLKSIASESMKTYNLVWRMKT